MKTAFEHFAAGPPAPSRPVPFVPEREAQQRWEEEGGRTETRQPAASARVLSQLCWSLARAFRHAGALRGRDANLTVKD